MGLAAPRKRRKLGQDPNNTTWARSSDSFGAKILSAQGWTPGSFLGAHDAPQAEHYSTASASHIRVALKEDNLGLGARPGNPDRDNFGSAIFSDILGRLNGKTEKQIGDEQQERADLGRRLYVEQKYGGSRFVRGGFLVGDKIENMASLRKYTQHSVNSETPTPNPAQGAETEPTPEDTARDSASSSPVSNQRQDEATPQDEESFSRPTAKQSKRTKKHKTEKPHSSEKQDPDCNPTSPQNSQTRHELGTESKSERRKRKLEKRARKEARRQEKTEKQQAESADVEVENDSDLSTAGHVPTIAPEQSPPAPSRPLRLTAGSRHHVRQRYIEQKRMASMDPRSLREILMVKS